MLLDLQWFLAWCELCTHFGNPVRIPDVGQLRPSFCPICHTPAWPPGQRMNIVGHGTYERQVLGIAEFNQHVTVHIRRFFARCCRKTISVLPACLYPRRCYAGGVILEAIRLHLVDGASSHEIRPHFQLPEIKESWRSLYRWIQELLDPMWSWLRKPLGIRDVGCALPANRNGWLRRLLAHAGVLDAHQADSGIQAAPALMERRVFFIRKGGLEFARFAGNIGQAFPPKNFDPKIHTE